MEPKKEYESNWPERYRPRKLEEFILPNRLQHQLGGLLSLKDLPHIMMIGPPGTGKTSSAELLLQGRNDYFQGMYDLPNLTAEKQLAILHPFFVTVSFMPGQKVAFIDEADGIKKSIAGSVRSLMERCAHRTAIIFAANQLGNLKGGLKSRCVFLDYRFNRKDHAEMLPQMISRCREILRFEGIDDGLIDVEKVVKSAFPDMRAVINALHLEVLVRTAKRDSAA